MDTIFAVTLHHAPECQCLLEGGLHVSGALFFLSGTLVFVAIAQGMTLDHLALVARAACILGTYRTQAIREMVLGRLSLLGHDIVNWLPPQSFGEGHSACPGASA